MKMPVVGIGTVIESVICDIMRGLNQYLNLQLLICDTLNVVPGTGAGVLLKLFNQ